MSNQVTLAELASDGGVQFIPKFHSGKSFIVTNSGVFVRGPYGAETFREVQTRDLNLECGYDDSDGSRNPFLYFGNNRRTLMEMLSRSGKYHTKRITGMGVVASELVAVARDIRTASRSLTGNSSEIVANGISKAISALSYLPTSAAFMDNRKSREFGGKVKTIIDELSILLAELPVSATYVANIDGDSLRTDDPVKLVEFMKRHGRKQKGFSGGGGVSRRWLWDQPVFENMAGPMSDGPNVCRYETWEQYDRLTI